MGIEKPYVPSEEEMEKGEQMELDTLVENYKKEQEELSNRLLQEKGFTGHLVFSADTDLQYVTEDHRSEFKIEGTLDGNEISLEKTFYRNKRKKDKFRKRAF